MPAPGERLVCVEFGQDRFARRCAAWLYQLRGLLEAAGAIAADDHVADEPEAGIAEIWGRWWREHEDEEQLNTCEQLVGALRGPLPRSRVEWLP